MFQNLYPKEEQESVYTLDYESLFERGYRGIIFDIDNTLVAHGAPATDDAIALVARLRKMGFSVCFLSNNDKQRVGEFCKPMDAVYIFKAGKPFRKGYEAAMKVLATTKEQTVSIGDQIFTDVLCGNLMNMFTILVKPFDANENKFIKFKRKIENLFIKW